MDEQRFALLSDLCSRSIDLMVNMNLLSKYQSEMLNALMSQKHPSMVQAMMQFEATEDAQQLCDTLRAFGQVIDSAAQKSSEQSDKQN